MEVQRRGNHRQLCDQAPDPGRGLRCDHTYTLHCCCLPARLLRAACSLYECAHGAKRVKISPYDRLTDCVLVFGPFPAPTWHCHCHQLRLVHVQPSAREVPFGFPNVRVADSIVSECAAPATSFAKTVSLFAKTVSLCANGTHLPLGYWRRWTSQLDLGTCTAI